MKTIIDDLNKHVIKGNTEQIKLKKCNCIVKTECPLNGNCLIKNSVYKGIVTSNEPGYEDKVYIGIAETTFKKRFSNHKKSFKIERYHKETELSKEVWDIKRRNFTPTVTWQIIKSLNMSNNTNTRCLLCLNEKLEILTYQQNNLLNQRNELISKCRHLNKKTLKHFDSKD